MKCFKGEIELKGNYEIEFGDNYLKVYDDNGNLIYWEDSKSLIIDDRQKKVTIELTQEQLDKVKKMLNVN